MKELKLLILEDSNADRTAILGLLKSKGFSVDYSTCDTLQDFKKLVSTDHDFNLIISDFNVKEGTGGEALQFLKDSNQDIPFIVVSGSINDDAAVELVRAGASDYVLKEQLQRLPITIEREFRFREERSEKERLNSLFNSVYENANVGLKICKLDGTIIKVNDEYTRISGYSKEELEGNNIMIVVPPDMMEEQMKEYEVFMEDRLPRSVERKFVRKDGSPMDVMINSQIVSSEGEDLLYLSVLDISELAANRALLEYTGSTNKVGGWEFDFITNEVRWTDQVYKIYGVDKDYKVNLDDAFAFYIEEDRPIVQAAFQKTVEERVPTDETVQFRDANGVLKWVRATGNPVVVGDQVVKLVGTFQDVTEDKQKELELMMLKNSYEELFEKSPNPILILNEDDSQIIDVNEMAIEKYGYTKEEFLTMTPLDLRPPEDAQLFLDTIQGKFETNTEVFNINSVRHMKKNGDVIYVDIQSRILESGEGKRDMIQIMDITDKVNAERALIESEKEYRTLVESSGALICKVALNGAITFANSGSIRLLGYQSNEMVGRNMMSFIHEEDIPRATESFQKVMQGEVDTELEVRTFHKDGSIVTLSVNAYPNYDNSGNVTSIAANASDITYLKTYQKQLEDSIDEKEVLIKEIHHRVKNNLAVVSGLLELQGLRVNDADLTQVLQESQARIKSIAMIHEKLYQSELFTQIDAGKYLEELTNNVAEAYMRPDKTIELNFDLDSAYLNVNQAVPFAIMANELLSNAFKHAFEGMDKGTLHVCLHKNGKTLEFCVRDNGVGIPEDFDPIQEGSLGFTLILNLSDQLDGMMSWSNLNPGSEFKLVFDPNEAARTWASSK